MRLKLSKAIKKITRMVFVFGLVICSLGTLYMQLPMFGKLPWGEYQARIERSPNYKNGRFFNQNETPLMSGNPIKSMLKFLLHSGRFFSSDRRSPKNKLPVIKTDLKNLDSEEDWLVWFGHSSYLIRIKGKNILVDPLFSEVSSPVCFFPRAFSGTEAYQAEDMPEIDYLIITHDHWDHLDYETMLKLRPKIKKVICGLGVGAHLEYWGFDREQIIEMDWQENISLGVDFSIYCLPARHFSGRGILRNRSLWASFLLKTNDFSIYIGGDSGYGAHYSDIGNKFGPIDLVILNSGQHDKNWKYIHMAADEVLKASRDMRAKMLLPVHLCKIVLANHGWKEPLVELSQLISGENFLLLTPIIGEKINLRRKKQIFSRWWENCE
ncbi:MAG: MBL fold metallo-hydrolase [Holosporaceae bacterium]|jgi:L-ascorbate metabolism protein UlaG (beta-lactamase superfamily)|nr:MBL fold metallo-hydrolase [Holosporaceae bacterium]